MAYTSFDSAVGGSPPTVNLAGLTVNTFTATTVAQLVSGMNAAVLLIVTGASANPTVGWRQTGQSGYTSTATQGAATQTLAIVGLNGSQQFDFYSSTTSSANLTVYVLGAFGTEYVPITPVTLAALSTGYSNYVLTSNAPGGVAAVFDVIAAYGVAFRYGSGGSSSDNFSDTNEVSAHKNFIVGLDGSQTCQGIGFSSQTPVLVGYFTGGIAWQINAVNVTPATQGSFTNLSPASGDASPIAFLYDNKLASGTYTYTVCEQGSGLVVADKYTGNRHGDVIAASPAQINMSNNTTNTLYERAYFISGQTLMGATVC